MRHCESCGFELGIGRFCTNCGQPIAGRHDGASTVRRPAPAPSGGPPPHLPPPDRRPTPPWPAWAGAAAVLVAVLVTALVLLVGSDDTAGTADTVSADDRERTERTDPADPADPAGDPPAGPEREVTSLVRRVGVPGTAPSSADARTGAPVTFEPVHLTDGDPTTCWRVGGDASGSAITLRFDEPVQVTGVGLVNGYAKSYPGYDGYRLNRRVLEVSWVFDDGSSITQPLGDDPSLQAVTVVPTWTEELRVEIVEVSSPASGPLGRDYTAISEIAVRGATAG